MRNLRNTHGAILIQSVIFLSTVVVLMSLTGELHRGWTLINELNRAADQGAALLVNGNYGTFGEQRAALDRVVVGNFPNVRGENQLRIEHLNANGEILQITDSDAPLPLLRDSAGNTDPALLLSRVRVTVIYPQGSTEPFPGGVLRTIFGQKEIELNGVAERMYVKISPPKHFRLIVRTLSQNNGEYRPICSAGSDTTVARRKRFYDQFCQVAAKLTEQDLANTYLASGIDDGIEAAQITIPSNVVTGFGANSEITAGITRPTEFKRLVNRQACLDLGNNADVIYSISCYPQMDGGYIEPFPLETRYLIIDEAQAGLSIPFATAGDACPGLGDDCCTNSCV